MATAEKSLHKQMSVESIFKQVCREMLSLDYVIQREKGRWSVTDKSNEISDICQHNPFPGLIFAERVNDDASVNVYVLDGKQRISNALDYINNEYSISKDVARYMIEYRGKGGKKETFDIRGKKFKNLPEELQDVIREYTFEIDEYINCTPDEIEYHMMRYNRGVRLNNTEKAIIKIGEDKAKFVRRIAESNFFSIDHDNYTKGDRKNGNVLRCIVECLMLTFFKNEWKKKPEEMCKYVRENSTDEQFDYISTLFNRLDCVMSDNVRPMFNTKNTFLYFGLFAEFSKLGIEDSKFVEFLDKFNTELHTKEINGINWDTMMENRSNREKKIVLERMNYLTTLMYEYFGIEENKDVDEPVVNEMESDKEAEINEKSEADFVSEAIGTSVTDEDVALYSEDLETYTLEVDNESELLNEENHESLVAIVAYAYEKDVDPMKWFIDYFGKAKTYVKDQMTNFVNMRNDFNQYYGCVA